MHTDNSEVDTTTHNLETEVARLRQRNRVLTLRLARALEQERKDLARELHDELGQALTAIKTDAVLISNQSQGIDAQSHASAQAILDTVSHIYEVVYSMLRRLRPGVLDEAGLSAAIEALVAEWRKHRPRISCTLDLAQELGEVDDLVSITVYRTVQELLTNVARHSAATHVAVVVARESAPSGEGLHVTVEDNGRGLDVGKVSADGGFGLNGLRERLHALNGWLDIASTPGHRTKVSVRVPIKQIEPKDG